MAMTRTAHGVVPCPRQLAHSDKPKKQGINWVTKSKATEAGL